MSFSKQYFDKELTELTSKDLIKFFESKQIESIHLEFKQYNPRANQDLFYFILPGITAFLNSEGGLLIFGAPKPTQENKKEYYQGELTPFPPDFIPDKDTIIRKISDNIRSMPLGIKFHLVEFDSGLVAVFEVPQSQIKPHQLNDKYLIRLDGQNRPAPHFLIQALMKEVKSPDLFLKVEFTSFEVDHTYHNIHFKSQLFNNVDSINDLNVEMQIKASIQYHIYSQPKATFPVLSQGVPGSHNQIIKIGNNNFSRSDDNFLEIGFVFGGEKSVRKISYFLLKLEGHINYQKFYETWIVDSGQNLRIDEFLSRFKDQNILRYL